MKKIVFVLAVSESPQRGKGVGDYLDNLVVVEKWFFGLNPLSGARELGTSCHRATSYDWGMASESPQRGKGVGDLPYL